MPEEEKIMEIDVNLIDEPPVLLHPETDIQYLEELAQSIKQSGLLNPIIVRPKGSRYQLVAGYRRWLACKKFGIPKIKARVVYMDDKEALLSSAIENIQRTDNDPIAEAKLYHKLVYEQGMSPKEVAEKVGKSVGYIEARLDLLTMPETIQQLVKEGKLQLGVIPLLKKIDDEEQRVLLASDIAHRGYTIKEATILIDSFLKYRDEMKEAEPEKVLEKAHETPLATCEWCKKPKPVTTFRSIAVCDDCYKELIYLWVKSRKTEEE